MNTPCSLPPLPNEGFCDSFVAGNREAISVYDDVPIWSAPFGQVLLETVRYRPGMSALDVGCGTGFPLLELAERLGPDSKVWGLDSWEPALQRAKEKFRLRGLSNIEITHSPAESMPFEDDCFDLIVSNNGLNNVQDPRLVLQQCKRVARVGCQLVFTANLPGTFGNFYQAFENSLEARGLSDQISALHSHIAAKRKPVTAWIDLARAAGWSVMSIRRSSFSWGFSCCAAFLSHWFIRLAFLPSWLEIMPEDQRNGILKDIEADLDSQAKARGGLNMEVPFFCIDAQSLP